MVLTIIKYNAGNIQSVLYALERIGMEAVVTDDHEAIMAADKVIFPGVGEASSAMRYLQERNLDKLIWQLKQPVLGICLGMQLMCRYSEENNTDCLGIFDEKVKLFRPEEHAKRHHLLHGLNEMLAMREASMLRDNVEEEAEPVLKIPQIGWNNIYNLKTSLFEGIKEESYCYFVHGYYAALGEHTIATTDYVQPYSSALHRDNFYGVQFHPEKSAEVGERILKNFVELI
ncbi:imidazole glycerol phosphate synthase subunit HisH [Foetidibacter luteolus]|uniref:imidazole glycerol phosphate synthase subunit HisH n=1 Tax=Foetidibacter luteolus TaxID=2608880 RepID=UPI00129BC753|nr:imidazole glycerol phosphate synthase subunit HisH [Foetidibacter luteolus]